MSITITTEMVSATKKFAEIEGVDGIIVIYRKGAGFGVASEGMSGVQSIKAAQEILNKAVEATDPFSTEVGRLNQVIEKQKILIQSFISAAEDAKADL